MLDSFNKNLIEPNDHLLLAVSGGVDSMVLLHYLQEYSKTNSLKLAVAHLDHQKRPESAMDCEFVKHTCKQYAIPCYVDKLTNKLQGNFHDNARNARYDFFVEIANKIGANKIILAHNANDNAETILMRLNRGSSFEGYRGILPKTLYKDIVIIRPMLTISRSEILEYKELHNVDFVVDSSNEEDSYTRNRYRHHVLPFLKSENPKYLEKFEQFSDYQTKAYHLIETLSNSFLQKHVKEDKNSLVFDVSAFRDLEDILKMEVIKQIVNLQTDNSVELHHTNINDIILLCLNDKSHVELHLDEKLHIFKSYNNVSFTSVNKECIEYEYLIHECKEITLPDNALVIITKYPNKYYGIIYKLCYNNLDLIFPLKVRNRRNGDKIFTDSGTKKIKDVFINKKIPLNTRNNVPILLNNMNEIIWIPNVYKAKTEGNEELYIIYQEGQ